MGLDVSTAELLEQWRAGSQAAADELYRRYAQRLLSLAQSRIGSLLGRRVGADDITQTVFRTFFRRVRDGEFAVDRSASLWHLLVRITLNKIHKKANLHGAAKRDLRRERSLDDGAFVLETAARDPTPSEAALLTDELDAALVQFDPDERRMFQLCLEGFPTPEIASALGISRWTVRRTLDRIGQVLERRFRETLQEG